MPKIQNRVVVFNSTKNLQNICVNKIKELLQKEGIDYRLQDSFKSGSIYGEISFECSNEYFAMLTGIVLLTKFKDKDSAIQKYSIDTDQPQLDPKNLPGIYFFVFTTENKELSMEKLPIETVAFNKELLDTPFDTKRGDNRIYYIYVEGKHEAMARAKAKKIFDNYLANYIKDLTDLKDILTSASNDRRMIG